MSLAPPVIRTLYRCLLRASKQGARPEVFGPYGAAAFYAYSESIGLEQFPSTDLQVRRLMRHTIQTAPAESTASQDEEQGDFETAYSSSLLEDPFAALRHTNTTLAYMFPEKIPSPLPIFDYHVSAALLGEQVSFNFFEPRYLKLVEMANKNQNYFILRMGRAGSILLQIQEQAPIHDSSGELQSYAVQCAAGPRLRIQQDDVVPIDSLAQQDDNETAANDTNTFHAMPKELPPLSIATELEVWDETDSYDVAVWLVDDPDAIGSEEKNQSADHSSYLQKRQEILQFMRSLSDLDKSVRYVGLPPIEPVSFSFWALRFVLPENDIPSRQKFLFRCRSNDERIDYVHDLLLNLLHKKRLKEAEQKKN